MTTNQDKEQLFESGYVFIYPKRTPICKICGEQIWEDAWRYRKSKNFVSWYHDDCIMESPTAQKRIKQLCLES